jgi:hypothetical protein
MEKHNRSYGRIKSLHSNKSKILKQANRGSYLGIQLNIKGKSQTESTHRLVALAFLPNIYNYPIVNHKDGNKFNNKLYNLQWTSAVQNTRHAKENKLHITTTYRITQLTLDNKFIRTFPSITNAMKITGVSDTKICGVAKGKRKTAGGFIWKYTDFVYEEISEPIGKSLDIFPNYIITSDAKVYTKSHKKYLSSRKNSDYEYVTLYHKKHKKDLSLHYLVATLYIKNPNKLPMVNHKNCNRSDNRVENLEWVTYSDNMKHKSNQRQLENDLKTL